MRRPDQAPIRALPPKRAHGRRGIRRNRQNLPERSRLNMLSRLP